MSAHDRIAELETERDILRLTTIHAMQYAILARRNAFTPAVEAWAYLRLLEAAGVALEWTSQDTKRAA